MYLNKIFLISLYFEKFCNLINLLIKKKVFFYCFLINILFK